MFFFQLPKPFPYSDIENPCLYFSSHCLINRNKSLFDIIAHELIPSYSGNLLTNENWSDFWLNEENTVSSKKSNCNEKRGVLC